MGSKRLHGSGRIKGHPWIQGAPGAALKGKNHGQPDRADSKVEGSGWHGFYTWFWWIYFLRVRM
jgi:hypothetical protein